MSATGKANARAVRAAVLCARALSRHLPAEAAGEAALFLLALRLERTHAARAGQDYLGSYPLRALGERLREPEGLQPLTPELLELLASFGGAPGRGSLAGNLEAAERDGEAGEAARALGELYAPIEALSLSQEALAAERSGRARRKERGVYYTPPELAAQVVSLALAHGEVPAGGPGGPRLFDCCAGAGIFLLASARALASRETAPASPGLSLRAAVSRCAGADLDPRAARAARAALAILARSGGPASSTGNMSPITINTSSTTGNPSLDGDIPISPDIQVFDSLKQGPLGGIDLLITNPPYGRPLTLRERSRLAKRYPAFRGAEIDLYAAYILRALELIRPGGVAALVIPDTWMTNARSAGLRAAVLEQAELRAVSDLGKPFPAAKDTRVQAIVLARRRLQRGSNLPDPDLLDPNPSGASSPGSNLPGSNLLAANVFDANLLQGNLLQDNLLGSRRPIAAYRGDIPLAPLEEGALFAQRAQGWQPYRSQAERAFCAAMEAGARPLGEVARVGYGLRTGNNARYVARGDMPADIARADVPPAGLRLVGGEDIEPYRLKASNKWLRESNEELRKLIAKQRGHPRVAIQRIRTNASRPGAKWLEAAWVPDGLICLDSLSTLAAADETRLWALLGWVNSDAVNRYHRLRTNDVNVKPSALRELPVPPRLLEPEACARLAGAVKARCERTARGERDEAADAALEAQVFALYGLDGAPESSEAS